MKRFGKLDSGNSLGTNSGILTLVVAGIVESVRSAGSICKSLNPKHLPKKVTAKRQQVDSTLLTLSPAWVILKSETVRTATLRGRVDSSRAPRGNRLAGSFFDN